MGNTYAIELFEFAWLLQPIVRGMFLTAVAVCWSLLFVRLLGLRALAKMTAFDLVATVATASLIAQAGTRSRWDEFAQAMAAIAAVFLLQWLLARLRLSVAPIASLLSNEPLLLMRNGEFLEDAMRSSRVSRRNLLEKMRAENIHRLEDVRAAVLETTGDISIIVGGDFEPKLMEGVRGFGGRER